MKILSAAFKSDPVLRRLGKVAAVGGAFAIASALYFQSRIRSNILNAPYFKEGLHIFKESKGVVDFLGPPIGIGKVDLGLKNNFRNHSQAQFEVPITGKKHSGQLFLWASRQDPTEEWTVDRLEVAVEDKPGQRILVHRAPVKKEEACQASSIFSE